MAIGGRPLRWIAPLVVGVAWLAGGVAGGVAYLHRYGVYRGFPTPVTPAGVARGTTRTIAFHSTATGRTEQYVVYLPPGYRRAAARGGRYPVLYILHGFPGVMTVFRDVGAIDVRADVLIHRRRMPPMIIVMPGGAQGTLHGDGEWADTPSGRWMDFVVDVVHDVDRRFATYRDRAERVLAGDSEGGYGAMNVGLRHLDLFSGIQSWSGYFTQTRVPPPFAHATRAQLAANSPADYVGALAPQIRRLGLRAWLFQGRVDPSDPQRMLAMAARLHAEGADVRTGFFPGGHDWGLWRAQLPRMLVAAGRWFEQPPRAGGRMTQVGTARTPAQLHRIFADRFRRCLALRLRPGVHIGIACRRWRRHHGEPDRVPR